MQYNNKEYYLLDKCVSVEEILSHIGHVCLSRKHNGKEFIARLMGIEGEDIVYRTKNGHMVLNPIKSIAYIAELA